MCHGITKKGMILVGNGRRLEKIVSIKGIRMNYINVDRASYL